MAVNELQKINADRELRQLLEQQEKEAHELPLPAGARRQVFRADASLQENARRAGMAKDMAIGMEKGMEKGVEKGVEKGTRKGVRMVLGRQCDNWSPPE